MKSSSRSRKRKASSELALVTIQEDADTTCEICWAEFIDAEDLNIHMKQTHKNDNKYSLNCNLCDKLFTDAVNLVSHVIFTHLSKINFCKYCVCAFEDTQLWVDHEKLHENNNNSRYSCSRCEIVFISLNGLRNHELTHGDCDGGMYLQTHAAILSSNLNICYDTFMNNIMKYQPLICRVCRYKSVECQDYVKHLKVKCCKSYACSICHSSFKTKKLLGLHYKKMKCSSSSDISLPVSKMKECTLCHANILKAKMKSHKKTCQLLKCSICSQTCETVQELTTHQTTSHPMSLLLKYCRYCHQEVVGALSLKKHVEKLHKSEYKLYKYKCLTCNSIFKHPQKLFVHYHMKHKDMRPFTCQICNQTFVLRKKFTIHIKLKHNGEGYIEFDENFMVFFTDSKSVSPFQPEDNPSLYTEEEILMDPILANPEDAEVEIIDNKDLTETEEGSKTDVDTGEEKKRSIKKKKDISKKQKMKATESSDDDQPLVNLRSAKIKMNRNSVGKLICSICKKYCYTQHNYHRHMSLHFKMKAKQCFKCGKAFKLESDLQTHMKTAHSTTIITETLKRLLERRNKNNEQARNNSIEQSKFAKTIKKVNIPRTNDVKVRVAPAKGNMSAKNFLENFVPEIDSAEDTAINFNATVRPVNCPITPKYRIKMSKYKEQDNQSVIKLRMPVPFSRNYVEETSVNVELVESSERQQRFQINSQEINIDYNSKCNFDNEEITNEAEQVTPEIGQEIMINNEATIDRVQKHFVLPKIDKKHKIQVAHLQPEAPYFKIIPIEQMMDEKPENIDQDELIALPTGKKLITVNPLAHLMGGKKVTELNIYKNKSYKYKPKHEYKATLAKALANLECSIPQKKAKK